MLFAAIGTQYGVGDGSTTFNVPDLRGEFIRGWSDGHTVDSGRTLGSAQGSQNVSHNHPATASSSSSVSDPGHAHSFNAARAGSGDEGRGGSSTNEPSNQNQATGGHGTGISVYTSTSVAVGNDGGTESRPRNIALLACIKT